MLAVSAELTWERAGQRMVEAARELAGARYAALGIPDDRGGFEEFLTTGISDEQRAAIGPLPRVHGMLGAMLQEPRPFRTPNIQDDPRFIGWPPAHPDMHSFMGVPIVSKGETIAAFYLTDKIGAAHFGDEDQHLIEMLAAHAAIAIENGTAVRPQPRAQHRRGAQPARARPPRLRDADALQRRAHCGGRRAARRPRRRTREGGAAALAGSRAWRLAGDARPHLRDARRRAGGGRPRADAAEAHRRAATGASDADRAAA